MNCGATGTFYGMGDRRAGAWVRLIRVAMPALGALAVHPQGVADTRY